MCEAQPRCASRASRVDRGEAGGQADLHAVGPQCVDGVERAVNGLDASLGHDALVGLGRSRRWP